MGARNTMRIGVVSTYPSPPEVLDADKPRWLIETAVKMGLGCLQLPPIRGDADHVRSLGDLAKSYGIEVEGRAPGLWGLTGGDADESLRAFLEGIEEAKNLGSRIIRTGYGHLSVATSRFSRDWPLSDHLDFLAQNLRIGGHIAADHGLLLAVENHCDFSGKEWARVFDAVDMPDVGAALDTGNGYTVFCDCNDDVQELAPYAITTHLKDLRVIDFGQPGRIPMIAVGAALGQGNVDIPLAVDTLAAKSPWADGLHLIIETGWPDVPEGKEPAEVRLEQFRQSLDYLNDLLAGP